MTAVAVEVILTRTITTFWSTRHHQLDLIAVKVLPASTELPPAIAFECECACGIELCDKDTEF
jgi:hypothetical protein